MAFEQRVGQFHFRPQYQPQWLCQFCRCPTSAPAIQCFPKTPTKSLYLSPSAVLLVATK